MANPTCTYTSLIESFPCLAGPLFTERQQLELRIWFNVLELQAIGGTDYRSTLVTTLLSDAVTFAGQADSSQLRTALLAINRNNAVAAGASPQSDPDDLFANVKCLQNVQRPKLDNIALMLMCKLGVHKNYTQ